MVVKVKEPLAARVRLLPRRPHPLHVPPPRRRAGAHEASSRQAKVASVAYETIAARRRLAPAAPPDERGRGTHGRAGRRHVPRERARRQGRPARRRARHAARSRRHPRRRRRRPQRGDDRDRHGGAGHGARRPRRHDGLPRGRLRRRDRDALLEPDQHRARPSRARTSSSAPSSSPAPSRPSSSPSSSSARWRRGSVVVDVAVDQGGCIETCRPTTHDHPTYEVHGVVHYCVPNMPGAVAQTSTWALTNTTMRVRREASPSRGLVAAAKARHARSRRGSTPTAATSRTSPSPRRTSSSTSR